MSKPILGNDPFATHPDWAARLPVAPEPAAPRAKPRRTPRRAERRPAPARESAPTAEPLACPEPGANPPVALFLESAPTSWQDNLADWLFPLRFAAGETLPNAQTLVIVSPSDASCFDLVRLARRLRRLLGRSVWAVATPETPIRERIITALDKYVLLSPEAACRRAPTGGAFVVRSEETAAFRSLSSVSWCWRSLEIAWPGKGCPALRGHFLRPFIPGKLKLGR